MDISHGNSFYPKMIDKVEPISPVSSGESSSTSIDNSLYQYQDSCIQGPVTQMNSTLNMDEYHNICNTPAQSGGAWIQKSDTTLPISSYSRWEPTQQPLNNFQQMATPETMGYSQQYDNPSLYQRNSANLVSSNNFQVNHLPQSTPQAPFNYNQYCPTSNRQYLANSGFGQLSQQHQLPSYPFQFPNQLLDPSVLLNQLNAFKKHFSQFLHQKEQNDLLPTKRKRTAYNHTQIEKLEKEYSANKFIPRPKRKELAEELSLTSKQVKVWFQNRRMKERKGKVIVKSEDNTI